ncbi:hypothetical protein G7Y89_g1632 [Cudoniella acicularis]|uniref:Uncharacterized protein n=1 Tax=Cudoniella acicularis TaxID=354080 RepID=A0A8H4RWN3_9HELO|nr:hypothetical protein G7Y89_g1632 [Cudoniella acicularis]
MPRSSKADIRSRIDDYRDFFLNFIKSFGGDTKALLCHVTRNKDNLSGLYSILNMVIIRDSNSSNHPKNTNLLFYPLIGELRDLILEAGRAKTSSIFRHILEISDREEMTGEATAKKNELADLSELKRFKEEKTNRVMPIY